MKTARLFALFAALTLAPSAWAQQPVFSIGFVATDLKRVNWVDGTINKESPGWFVELSDEAGRLCGATMEYHQLPWKRILQRVKSGQLSAALNSSFKSDRAEYGAYPITDGRPDISRAHSHYAYHLYALEAPNLAALSKEDGMRGVKIAAEPASAIWPVLEDRGAEIVRMTNYQDTMDLLKGKRVAAVAGIDSVFDAMIANDPGTFGDVVKSEGPLLERAGYVMFSKITYAAFPKAVECFWTQSARLRQTPWYEDMRRKYE